MLPNPLALIAEITHRCPLHCVYCSNPMQLAGTRDELSTEEWTSVFQQSGKLGMLHAHFTGGEPLARADLTELISAARAAGLYTNLITSAGAKAHAHKIELARAIRRYKIAFTVNLVVHRQNLDHLEEMIAFIEQLNPERVEIAHTQYYGWALANRAALMPTQAQLEKAVAIVAEAEKRLAGRIRIDSVVPDYYAKYPKACMGGWGRRLMLINPAGKVLPCHAAEVLPGFWFENVRDKAGCRCQAFLLAGDASVTDPACSLSPSHGIVESAVREANSGTALAQPSASSSFVQLQKQNTDLWSYRTNRE